MSPYALTGGLVLAIGLCLGGEHVGRKLERSTWQAKELATAGAAQRTLVAAQEKYAATLAANESTARKASADHEKAISDLTRQYDAARTAIRAAGGLRVSRAICGDQHAGTTAAAGAGGPDGAAAGTVALPAETERRLLELTQEADALAERLRALQAWVRGAGLYGPPP